MFFVEVSIRYSRPCTKSFDSGLDFMKNLQGDSFLLLRPSLTQSTKKVVMFNPKIKESEIFNKFNIYITTFN